MSMNDFQYTIHRKKRVKYMRLEVGHDQTIKVVAPFWVLEKDIKKFIKEKQQWIQQAFQKQKDKKVLLAKGTREEYLKYKEIARDIITKKVEYWNQFYDFEYNRISIKNLKTQWGSCSSKNNLNFNYKLIFLSEEQSDYVVVHELCHLQEMNHGARFWALVEKTIPDYKRIVKDINGFLIK